MTEPQPYRETDLIAAIGRGYSAEDIVAIEMALQFFDGNYNTLLAVLRQYGVSDRLISAVLTVAEQEMGCAREDVDILDASETFTWGLGYGATTDEVNEVGRIKPRKHLLNTTRYWFNKARRDKEQRSGELD